MKIGTFFSDSYMNYVLYKSNYHCFNLYNDIITKHLQHTCTCTSDNFINKEKLHEKLTNEVEDFNNMGLYFNSRNDFVNNNNFNNFKTWDELK